MKTLPKHNKHPVIHFVVSGNLILLAKLETKNGLSVSQFHSR